MTPSWDSSAAVGEPHIVETIDESDAPTAATWGAAVVKAGSPRDIDRDRFTLSMAILVMFLLAGAGVLTLVWFLPAEKMEDLRGVAPLILSPLATLAGTGFAWFYGDRATRLFGILLGSCGAAHDPYCSIWIFCVLGPPSVQP